MSVHCAGIRVLAVAALFVAVSACSANENGSSAFKVNAEISDEVTARAVGLPAYPGAKPYKDEHDDSSAADIGISTPLFGLKVAALELETSDRPEKVAAFYRDALSKYGTVLECRDGKPAKGKDAAGTDELECEPGELDKHSVVYKVGTENNQRIVAVEPHGNGTKFSLVHVNIRDDSEE